MFRKTTSRELSPLRRDAGELRAAGSQRDRRTKTQFLQQVGSAATSLADGSIAPRCGPSPVRTYSGVYEERRAISAELAGQTPRFVPQAASERPRCRPQKYWKRWPKVSRLIAHVFCMASESHHLSNVLRQPRLSGCSHVFSRS